MAVKPIVDRRLVDEFRDRGFIVVPDLLTPGEVERYGRVVAAAVAERTAGDDRPLDERSRYEQSFVQCQNLWEDVPEVRPLTFHPRVAQAAAELLGAGAVRLWHDQALVKEPGGRETDAHQDQAYWPIAEPRTVTAWIPFEGSTLASGCMGYVPGSHRLGLAVFVNIFRGEPEDLLARPELAGREPVFVEVPAGSVAFHHGLTAHLARPNTTDRARTIHTMIYVADGCTRGSADPHPSVDRPGIAVGAPIASAVTPIAWPRPAGELPPRPDEPWPTSRRTIPGLYPRPAPPA
jgi:ectoine hydroxylase-related dioxygenase (phytanoyl-CoA dioxygenase family)